MTEYKKLLETMYIIKESTLYRKNTREIQPLMNAKGYSFVKAASISIRKISIFLMSSWNKMILQNRKRKVAMILMLRTANKINTIFHCFAKFTCGCPRPMFNLYTGILNVEKLWCVLFLQSICGSSNNLYNRVF